jgi:signal transduction histidine kinase
MHEIKTPLSIIKLNNELRNKILGEDKYSTKIEAAIKTLQNSYEDMTFLHTKKYISYNLEILLFKDILEKRVSYFKSVSNAQGRVLNLEINSNCLIKISQIEIERLIDNNLSNAIKYSNINSIVTINLTNNILTFKTFGKEIKNKNKIFKRYERENENHGGHGLGLSIIKDICKKYKIEIELKYENNQNIFIYSFICHTNDTK